MQTPFTLRQLEIASALCTHSSFRLTADQLGISQASVSNQIKMLEHQLGFSIFDRQSGRKPRLSLAGAEFIDDLKAFHEASERLSRHRLKVPRVEKQTIRIMIGEMLLASFIKPKLIAFLDANPELSLEFVPTPPVEQSIILDDKFDFLLAHFGRDVELADGFSALAYSRSGILGHPRFADGNQQLVSAHEMSSLPFIMPPRGTSKERAQRKVLASHGIRPENVVAHLQYTSMTVDLVARGSGVAVLPEVLIPRSARGNVIMLYPLKDWKTVFFRKQGIDGHSATIVEKFMVDSILGDPDYQVTHAAAD